MKDKFWKLMILSLLPSVGILALTTQAFSRPITLVDLIAPVAAYMALLLFLWHRMVKAPAANFLSAIRRTINGDYRARFSCEDGCVFESLSIAFNQMMDCVESQMDELSENRVLQNQLYENEKIYRSALELTCERVFEVDLTHNRVLYGYEKYRSTFPFLRTEIYDDMINALAENAVAENDAGSFLQTFSRSSLLRSFHRPGVPEVSADYRLKDADGEMTWYFASVVFLNSSDSSGLKIIGYVKNINERKRQEIEILNQSQKDGLTGLYNKKVTGSMIGDFLAGEGQHGTHAVIMVDIDNFKRINDTFGHTQGDAALTEVSKNLQNLFRVTDIVGRVGGDEFLVLMKNASDTDALFARLKSIGDSFQAIRLEDSSYRISGSVGVSLYPRDGTDYETLFKKSDIALYYSKKHGKDQFCFYDKLYGSSESPVINEHEYVPQVKPIDGSQPKQS